MMTRRIPGRATPPERPLTPEFRLHTYWRQNGTLSRLTKAQGRRHRKKSNRAGIRNDFTALNTLLATATEEEAKNALAFLAGMHAATIERENPDTWQDVLDTARQRIINRALP